MNQYSVVVRKYFKRSAPINNLSLRRLALASVSLLAISTISTQAMAQCEPDPPEDGDEVVCEGVDDDGIELIGRNISLTIQEGASVSATTNFAVLVDGADNLFRNHGEIRGRVILSEGFQTPASFTTVGYNAGHILGPEFDTALTLAFGVAEFENLEGALISGIGFSDAVELSFGFSGAFTNSGLIAAERGNAIIALHSSATGELNRITIRNAETGIIQSEGNSAAIRNTSGGFIDVTNSGIIRGDVFALNLNEFSVLRNEQGGVIDARSVAAVYASANDPRGRVTILNSGLIRSPEYAVWGGAFLLENSGSVTGDITEQFAAVQEVRNSGTITGNLLFDRRSDSLENTGLIIGSVDFGDGVDVFRDFGGEIRGGVTLGDGDDFVLVRTGAVRGATQFIDPGNGLDSFGVSVDSEETISLTRTSGFEGFAVEARYENSNATLVSTTQSPFAQTVSLLGDGIVTNTASISVSDGDAVRLYSNALQTFFRLPNTIAGPLGNGLTFINEGVIESLNGYALISLTDPGFRRPASGNDWVENRNIITGASFLDDGDDVFINAGIYEGEIDLGAGDDLFVTDVDADSTSLIGEVLGGAGFDAIGFYTQGSASSNLGISSDFESAAIFVDNNDATFEIIGIETGHELPFLRVFGSGTVINRAPIVNEELGRISGATDPNIELISDGLRFENHAMIDGTVGAVLRGNNQVLTNNGTFTRSFQPTNFIDSDGHIIDTGIGNTIINNGTIDVSLTSMGGILVGDETSFEDPVLNNFLEQIGNGSAPRSNVVNNGTISAGRFRGAISLETENSVSVVNTGVLDDIASTLVLGDLEIENRAGGTIQRISTFSIGTRAFLGVDVLNEVLRTTITNRSGAEITQENELGFAIAFTTNSNTFNNSIGNIIYSIENEGGAIINSADGPAIFAGADVACCDGQLNEEVNISLEIENAGIITNNSHLPALLVRDDVPDLNAGEILHATNLNFSNSGTIANNFSDFSRVAIQTDSGLDVLRNAGVIIGNVLLGSGDDTFLEVADGYVEGSIAGGDGIDTFALEQFSGDVVLDRVFEFERLDISTNVFAVINDSASLSSSFAELVLREGLTLVETDLSLDATILENGILGGNGAIIGNVTNYGTIAPGASIGDLTINGDLTLAANSVLHIEFDDNASDVLTVIGDVSIDDANLEFTSLGANLSSVHSFEFLTANSVSGQFSEISFNGFTGFADLTFANGVLGVTITPQFEFSPSLTANSVSVAGYLNDLIVADAVNTSAENIVSTLFSLSANDTALNAAMLSLQPEAFAATAAISVENAFLINDMIRDRARIEIYREDGKYFWLSGAGSFANYEGDLGGDGTSSFKTNSRGIIGGAEIVRGDALIGIYGGTVESDQELRTGLSQTEADGFVTGGYGAWRIGKISNTASFGYVFGDAETDRVVPALSEQMQADYDFDSFTAQGRSQYDFTVNGLLLSPFVGATYVRSERGTIVESGGASALHVSDQSESFLFLDVGSAIEKQFSINDRTKARAAFTAGWRYEALGHSIDAYSSIGMDGPFNLAGAAADFDRSRLVLGGDGSIDVGENISVFAKYRGEFGGNYTSNRISGGLTIKF